MPVFNGEKYLKEAINSVLNQTYKDFEFIIINDGSTDSTEQIISSFADSRIKYIKQENQGVARSLNNGLKLVNGDYIWRHDADDICLKDQLERQVIFLGSHPEHALVGTQIAFMTDRGKIAYKYRQPKNEYFKNQDSIEVSRDDFKPFSPITHATVLMKTDVVKNLNGYRTEFLTSEDYDLWLRLLDKNKAAVLNYCSYFVRLNKTSATQKYKSSIPYFRQLCLDYADQRIIVGSDPIMRGETVPTPPVPVENDTSVVQKKGMIYRNDLLDFHYKVMLNAKDWVNVFITIKYVLKDGWKLSQTWKALLFPIIGKHSIALGVKFKALFR